MESFQFFEFLTQARGKRCRLLEKCKSLGVIPRRPILIPISFSEFKCVDRCYHVKLFMCRFRGIILNNQPGERDGEKGGGGGVNRGYSQNLTTFIFVESSSLTLNNFTFRYISTFPSSFV